MVLLVHKNKSKDESKYENKKDKNKKGEKDDERKDKNGAKPWGCKRERERERERESYTLVNKGKSAVLLSIQRNLKNENKFKHRLFIYVHFLCT